MKAIEGHGESFWVLAQGHLNASPILSVDSDFSKCRVIVCVCVSVHTQIPLPSLRSSNPVVFSTFKTQLTSEFFNDTLNETKVSPSTGVLKSLLIRCQGTLLLSPPYPMTSTVLFF